MGASSENWHRVDVLGKAFIRGFLSYVNTHVIAQALQKHGDPVVGRNEEFQ